MSIRVKRVLGLTGMVLLFLIIPVKAVHVTDLAPTLSTFIGIAPSVLGPIGLLFLVLSSSSPRLARLTLLQTTLLVAALSVGLEFAQLLPRPGFLSYVHYTFDWMDVAASLVSVALGYGAALLFTSAGQTSHEN